jgi:mercuric ion transport protein
MQPETGFLTRYDALAGPIFLVLTAAFGVAVLIQIFLAGEASMIEPDDWGRHVAWIHLFQWLSVPLPFAAYLARRRLGFAALNCIPIVIIGLQYVLIHRAIEQARAPLAGLHAVCGALLLAYVAFVLQGWRQESS